MTDTTPLAGKKLLHIATYAAPYEGNFVRSLRALEAELKSYVTSVAYVFPQSVKNQPWYEGFAQDHEVHVTGNNFNHSHNELFEILEQVQPDFIHTHFDGYDISACKACRRYERKHSKRIVQFWHLHNAKGYGLRSWHKYYWGMKFWWQYGYHGKHANIISVNDYMLRFARHYRTMWGGKDFDHSAIIYNCLDLTRIETPELPLPAHTPYTFLALGGRNAPKRVDVLLNAATILANQGTPFQILITKGSDTEQVVCQYFNNDIPAWCKLLEQDGNINHLFQKTDCFISTSAYETFSYAICEATIYGLPVIQSNIEGTAWNEKNPSTYVFESLNAQQLSQQMLAVMNEDRNDLAKRCAKTRQQNSTAYPISKWCEMVIEFYKKAL